ncbi:dihydropyrimidinase [Rhizobium sp. P32RR-XVIII]|uniref:dihydropyrimidinase n=1 Tax=Rhizobium sp. P32RR-XVIII TaxID=2726738 RepID=UPI0014564491|nr:dihydropyrimidinase [Rhizobium sp. P32RR-XVIII]NLS07049.1 dihydropyrimidinase [Rhizobium sp. P32RR-XVIII]
MADFDLVVRNGRIFTPDGLVEGDIASTGGVIAAIGKGLPSGRRELDAEGHLILPGGIDAHCHIDQLTSTGARTADTFRSASIPAAFGGTTTLMPFAVQHRGTSLRAAVEDYKVRAAGQSVVDYAFHLIVTDPTPQTLETDIPALAAEGFTSVKIYLTYDALRLDDRSALDVLAVARREQMMVMIHAESHDLIAWLTERMLGHGYGDLKYLSRSRPIIAERDATHHAITMAELIDVPILIVHVSSKDALEQIRWSRTEGVRTYAETCPQYLVLSEEDLDRPDFEAAKYCCSPPLRDQRHQKALWKGLADGSIDVYSSDHSAFFFEGPDGKMRNGKNAAFNKVPYGLPGLETRLPLLFSEGVGKGRLSLGDFVRVTAERPAELYGLQGRKGILALGADADIVVWNEKKRVRIGKDTLHDELDYTPYEGMQVEGWPQTTLVRGEIVCHRGELFADTGGGRLLVCARPNAAKPTGQPVTGFDVTDNTMKFR